MNNTMRLFIGIDIGVANVYAFDDGTIIGHGMDNVEDNATVAALYVASICGSKRPIVVLERLHTKNMGEYTKHMKDAMVYITAALELLGIKYIGVPSFDTSRTCSKCGSVNTSSRDGRNFLCVNCGFECDADVNAAKNIKKRGKKNRRLINQKPGYKKKSKKHSKKKRSHVAKHIAKANSFEKARSGGRMNGRRGDR